ncbi:hypothetical protein CN221_28970, partial [Sinorhizobium meliloti]
MGSFRKSLRSILSRRPWTRKVPYGAETWPTGIAKCSRLGLSGILCGGPVSSVEEPLAKDDGELCLCLDPFP